MRSQPQRAKLCGTQAGTTLIETLVVIAIMSVILTIVAPSVRAGMAEFRLRQAVRTLGSAVSDARGKAVHLRRAVTLSVRVNPSRLLVDDAPERPGREYALPDSVVASFLGPDDADEQANQSAGVGERQLVFFPDGAVPQLHVRLSVNQRAVELTTDPLTGGLIQARGES